MLRGKGRQFCKLFIETISGGALFNSKFRGLKVPLAEVHIYPWRCLFLFEEGAIQNERIIA